MGLSKELARAALLTRAGEKCGVASGGVSLGGRRGLSVGARTENQLSAYLLFLSLLGLLGRPLLISLFLKFPGAFIPNQPTKTLPPAVSAEPSVSLSKNDSDKSSPQVPLMPQETEKPKSNPKQNSVPPSQSKPTSFCLWGICYLQVFVRTPRHRTRPFKGTGAQSAP